MTVLLDRIASGDVILCDGAMGTMLIERGLELGECPEAWNLTHPDLLAEIAGLYTNAGADIVETNTFGGSPLKLVQYGLESRTEEINRSAVRAARQGADGRALVALSCGPTGRMLKPYGDVEPREIREAYERQFAAAVAEGIDAVIVETMTDLAEATIAVGAAKATAPSLPVIATMTFDSTPRGFITVMGVTVAQAASGLAAAGADLIGSNCGNGIDNMVLIAREFQKHTSQSLAIQSNAGLPHLEGSRAVYQETPALMAGRIEELVGAGVAFLGGCCGTTPDHTAAFRREISRLARH